MNGGGDYVTGACLALIAPQDVQLTIQMPQEYRSNSRLTPVEILIA